MIQCNPRLTLSDCLAQILSSYQGPQAVPQDLKDTISLILNTKIKPLFLPSPHSQVNLDTGRKLHIPEGSRHPAAQDFYDDQPWKVKGKGCWNTLRWCILHLEVCTGLDIS